MTTIKTMKSLKEATTIKPGNQYIIATGGELAHDDDTDSLSYFYEITDESQVEFLLEYNEVYAMLNAGALLGVHDEYQKYLTMIQELMPQFKDLFPDYCKYHARTDWAIIKL